MFVANTRVANNTATTGGGAFFGGPGGLFATAVQTGRRRRALAEPAGDDERNAEPRKGCAVLLLNTKLDNNSAAAPQQQQAQGVSAHGQWPWWARLVLHQIWAPLGKSKGRVAFLKRLQMACLTSINRRESECSTVLVCMFGCRPGLITRGLAAQSSSTAALPWLWLAAMHRPATRPLPPGR